MWVNAPFEGDEDIMHYKMHCVDYMWHNVLLTFLWDRHISLHWVWSKEEGILGIKNTIVKGNSLRCRPLILGMSSL